MATASERRSLMLEIDMMKGLEFHRHLVTMVACCTVGSHLALIMEFISGGNLHDFLRSCRQKVSRDRISLLIVCSIRYRKFKSCPRQLSVHLFFYRSLVCF